MPHANTEVMTAHLAEIARHVTSGAHACLILDGAGWHGSKTLIVPDTVTLMPLPPYSPELNPVGNLWQYLRQNDIANRVFDSYDEIVDVCCTAWNSLTDMPQRLATITLRDCANVNGSCRWYYFTNRGGTRAILTQGIRMTDPEPDIQLLPASSRRDVDRFMAAHAPGMNGSILTWKQLASVLWMQAISDADIAGMALCSADIPAFVFEDILPD